MESNSIQNRMKSDAEGAREIRAPGFANTSSGAGGASPSRGADMGDISMSANEGLNKPKKSRSAMIGMIVFALIAACGIGFGVWAMLDGNSKVQKKDERVAELNNQVESLQQEKNDLSERIDELENSHSEAQADTVQSQEGIAEVQEQLVEEQKQEESGYRVESIGQCVADSGTGASSVFILKCEATTSQGAGKFVYNSQDNVLRFVLGQ